MFDKLYGELINKTVFQLYDKEGRFFFEPRNYTSVELKIKYSSESEL